MEQGRLFDDKPYIRHFHLPENVIPLPTPVVENPGHDDVFDNLKCQVYDFPETPPFEPEAA